MNENMYPTHQIHKTIKPNVKNTELPIDEYCMVCGVKHTEGVPRNKAFSGNFNDWSSLKNPDGTHVCPACRYALQEGWLRNYPYIIGDKLIIYISKAVPKGLEGTGVVFRERSNLLDDLFNLDGLELGKEFVVCIPNSRKHMAFKSTINYTEWYYTIQHGNDSFIFNTKELKQVKLALQRMYTGGFSKAELRKGEYAPHKPSKYGLDKFFADTKIIDKARGPKSFDLIVDLLYN
ncbi:MAG: hypothetical protein A4E26_00126 [Methanobacterium sp. PtaU1.Bin097]|nr:MAG: hypothetical protein A4E26_00126 [Methanobacterium sp. PtaU1.Bin097]